MKIYIDENLPPQLARGLAELEKPNPTNIRAEVIAIKDKFGEGTLDEDWIPILGKEKAIVITQDKNIHKRSSQRELYEKNGLGIFFFVPPSKNGFSYWMIVEKLIERWDEIKTHARKSKTPFSYNCPCRGKITKIK